MVHFRLSIVTSLIVASVACVTVVSRADEGQTSESMLEVGKEVPDFKLSSSAGKEVTLSEVTRDSPAVLVVLRGFPGYQCPLCTRQVQEILSHSKQLQAMKAQVLLLYPGQGSGLKKKAEEFVGKTKLPDNVRLLLDTDLKVTKALGLRWDAAGETSYPSTLIIDQSRLLAFKDVSKSHGDRTPIATVLEELKMLGK